MAVGQQKFDVLIAGGGVAGAAAAAALSPLGLRILIVEPGPSHGRRLAGELIHPPGVDGLCQLGLLSNPPMAGSVVNGFAIFPAAQDDGLGSVILPYGETAGSRRCGLAIEHRSLQRHLLETARRFPGVSAWIGARVIRMEAGPDGRFTALVRGENDEARIRAGLILGADGPMSQVRKMVGISHEARRYSAMMGVEVEDTHLPRAGYGNIFLNPAGVAYAYAIGKGRARVMFEVLKGADPKESVARHLDFFPAAFRRDIETVLCRSKPLAAANYCIIPGVTVKRNVALVGDARGCCHPLTASGITASVKDAMVLRDALRETNLDVATALHRYARACARLQFARRTLAEELHEAFLAQTPEALLLKQCIFSYWRRSANGRARSMALLSTVDSGTFPMATQYAMVALQAFRLLPLWLQKKAAADWRRGMRRLTYKGLAFQYAAINQWL